MTDLIIQLISGAVGGNLIGALVKKINLGVVLNTIMGLLGGAGGSQLLEKLGVHLGSGMPGAIGGAAAGGGVLMAIVGIIKSVLGKK